MNHTIEKRLGYLIGYLRREKLSAGDCAFKQENFIKSDLNHPFEGIANGKKVCSLTTLSRLENGKHQNSYALLDYFLNKLGIQYKIKESLLEKEHCLLDAITSGFASMSLSEVLDQIEALSAFYTLHSEDVLFRYNHQVVNFARAAIQNKEPKRQEFDKLVLRLDLYPSLLQFWLFDCGACLKEIHPDYWDLSLEQHRLWPDRIRSLHQTMLHYDETESMIILKTLIPNLNEKSLIISKLKDYASQIRYPFESAAFHTEYQRCLLSARNLSLAQEGNSALYHSLKRFIKEQNPQNKLILFETQLLKLLQHEPQPKAVSKALTLHVLTLCKQTKSYKPLISVIQLISENSDIIDTLSLNIG